ncbi:Mucin-3A like [Actinidia chinensis var. chinensis]|uniref:Mucin-3A like n=1 Tax=Actinidia chinensis var. chinensis TaxID=1590841 RepID=A0A2R6PB97_ACTCC|nr:Mucin-3A like [Actinidia chinensis var. chinensis]
MKRQRKMDGNGPAVATRRRSKREVAAEAEERKVVEERRECWAEAEAVVVYWEEWPGWWSGVDEQMSWGTFWCPSWDIEYLGEAYNALYSDVVWDDDIWHLKEIKDVPNP